MSVKLPLPVNVGWLRLLTNRKFAPSKPIQTQNPTAEFLYKPILKTHHFLK